MRKTLILFLKSVVVGAASLVPGVSGGTIAIVLDIYDSLLSSISRYMRDIRKNTIFLATFALGAALGIVLLARAVLWLFENFQLPVMSLFIGCVLGSIPALLKKSSITRVRIRHVAWVLVGFSIVMSLSFLPESGFLLTDGHSALGFLLLAIAGVVVSVAFILPGLSTSYMLLVLGIYNLTLRAVSELDILFLLPLLTGGVIGTIATARVLETAMRRYTAGTYMIILGFVLGSTRELVNEVKRMPTGWEIPICIVMLAAGLFTVMWVSKYGDD